MAKALRPTPYDNFEIVQLNDNLMRPICIEANLSPMVMEMLIKCFKANINLFLVSPNEIPIINPNVVCH